jgi:hypothetical protein
MQNILFFSRAKLAKFINNALSEKWKLIVYTLTVLTSILAGLPTAVVKSGMSQITSTAPILHHLPILN